MRVTIHIEDRGLEVEISDDSEVAEMYGGDSVLSEQWSNGSPEELIHSVVARAVAAYQKDLA